MAKYRVIGKCSVLTKRGVAYPNGVFKDTDVPKEQIDKLLKSKKIELVGGKTAKPEKPKGDVKQNAANANPTQQGSTENK